MKELITILFMFSFILNAQIELSESYAFTKDKKWHTGVGVAEGSLVYSLVYNKTGDASAAFRTGFIGINFLSISKEIGDMIIGKPMSLADILYANIGWFIGSSITHLTIKGIEKRKAKKIKQGFDVSDNIHYSLDNPIFINNR